MINASGFIEVLQTVLVPYLRKVNENPKLMMDIDPKHASKRVAKWIEENSINWWKTPAESLDLNPIENVWHKLKD
uniref:Tc1-like transposase DDE domain-containing protein n=1 Tax=Amphimedon queenslandica TaxID=400682 RepID=A0A1X7VXG7_AMPQE